MGCANDGKAGEKRTPKLSTHIHSAPNHTTQLFSALFVPSLSHAKTDLLCVCVLRYSFLFRPNELFSSAQFDCIAAVGVKTILSVLNDFFFSLCLDFFENRKNSGEEESMSKYLLKTAKRALTCFAYAR